MNTVTQERQAGIPQGIIITLISLVPVMAVITLMPVVPTLRNHFQNIPHIEMLAPFVISAPGICVALFSPFAGLLADKIGRRKLLLIFSALYGVGGILPFFATTFPTLIAGRLVLGIGEAFILTVANILLGDYFQEDRRNTWLMIQSIAGPLFGFFIISGSGYLSSIGWQYPFLIYGFTFIIPILAYIFVYEPTPKTEAEKAEILKNKQKLSSQMIFKVFVPTFVASILYYVYTLHFSLALDKIGITDPKQVGNITAFASLMIPVGGVVFKLFGKRSDSFQFAMMFSLIGIGLIGVGLSKNITFVMISAMIQQLGCGMAIPILIAVGLRALPAELRGRGMGLWSSGFFLGLSISPFVVGGVSYLTGGILNAFLAFGIICLTIVVGDYLRLKLSKA